MYFGNQIIRMLLLLISFKYFVPLSKAGNCDSSPCHSGSTCVATRTSYTCSCLSGFLYVETVGCVDIDECEHYECLENQKCFNNPGTFECVCLNGYVFNVSADACEDVNECLKNPCKPGRVCHNVNGTFDCLCQEGYFEYEEEVGCIDVDECRFYENLCNETTCVNTPGSYYCDCKFGYMHMDEVGCIKVPRAPPNIFVLWIILCVVVGFAISRFSASGSGEK